MKFKVIAAFPQDMGEGIQFLFIVHHHIKYTSLTTGIQSIAD